MKLKLNVITCCFSDSLFWLSPPPPFLLFLFQVQVYFYLLSHRVILWVFIFYFQTTCPTGSLSFSFFKFHPLLHFYLSETFIRSPCWLWCAYDFDSWCLAFFPQVYLVRSDWGKANKKGEGTLAFCLFLPSGLGSSSLCLWPSWLKFLLFFLFVGSVVLVFDGSSRPVFVVL